MPEKRLRGNDFLHDKNDMHRFKKIFSTTLFFIIYIFCMISSFFSFCGHVPFMAETGKARNPRRRKQHPPGPRRNAPEATQRATPSLASPFAKMGLSLKRGALQPSRRTTRTRNAGRA